MENTTKTFTCDRCKTTMPPDGTPRYPQDWSKLEVHRPWVSTRDTLRRVDLCAVCSDNFDDFVAGCGVEDDVR